MYDAATVDSTTVYPDGRLKRATLVLVGDQSPWRERPDAEEVYVMDFADEGILIPWPRGISVKSAILEWASREQVTLDEIESPEKAVGLDYRAYFQHVDRCNQCSDTPMSPCDEGRRLSDQAFGHLKHLEIT
jgi:hypothetical protein